MIATTRRRLTISTVYLAFFAFGAASANEIRSDGKPGVPCNLGQTTRKQREAMASQESAESGHLYATIGGVAVFVAGATLFAWRVRKLRQID